MTIFEKIEKDPYYYATAMKIAKNHDDAYDLMMDTALKIHEKKYTFDNIRSLYYTIALRDWCRKTKEYTLIEELIDDKEVGKYHRDIIDCALNLLEITPSTRRQFVTVSIFKEYLKLKSQKKVAEKLRLKQPTVNHHIKKFSRYVGENCNMYSC